MVEWKICVFSVIVVNTIHIPNSVFVFGYVGCKPCGGWGITCDIMAVKMQGLYDGTVILLGGDNARLVGAVHDVRYDQGGKNPHDDDDHHDLYERKTLLMRRFASAALECKQIVCH